MNGLIDGIARLTEIVAYPRRLAQGAYGLAAPVLPGALAVFGGAWFAFQLQRLGRARERRDADYLAYRTAHFVVGTHVAELMDISRQHVAPVVSLPDPHQLADGTIVPRWLGLQPAILNPPTQRQAFERLAFLHLFRASDLMSRLILEEHMYLTYRGWLERHAATHLRMQDMLAAPHPPHPNPRLDVVIQAIIGPAIPAQLRAVAGAVLTRLEPTIMFSRRTMRLLELDAKLIFTERRFRGFVAVGPAPPAAW